MVRLARSPDVTFVAFLAGLAIAVPLSGGLPSTWSEIIPNRKLEYTPCRPDKPESMFLCARLEVPLD